MGKKGKCSFGELVDEFLMRHANINTRNNFLADTRALTLHFDGWNGRESPMKILGFIRKQEASGLSSSTVRGRVIRIRKLYEFLKERGHRQDNPVDISSAPKFKDHRAPRCPTILELKAVLVALKGEGENNLRDKLIFAFLFYEAFRVHEVCALNVGSFEEVGGRYVGVVKGKGGRVDSIALFPQTSKFLKQYLRHIKSKKPKEPLFCSLRNEKERLSTRAVRKRIDGYFAKAGVRKGLSCHSLRHAHATILAARGYPLTGIQKRLRHSSITTSLKYYFHDEVTAYLPTSQHPDRLIDVGIV